MLYCNRNSLGFDNVKIYGIENDLNGGIGVYTYIRLNADTILNTAALQKAIKVHITAAP